MLNKPIKVAITDDHPVVRNGLRNILEHFNNITVIATYGTGKELLEGITAQQPDILLLDMRLPDTSGDELAQTIVRKYPKVKIIVLSSIDVTVQVKKMLRIGCMGYLLKDSDDQTILQAIETVYNGGQYLSPVLSNNIIQDSFKNKKTSLVLSRRETEVLKLIVDEYTNQEIAEKLFLSPHTVESHRVSLLHKLNVKNTAGLVKVAIQEGLI